MLDCVVHLIAGHPHHAHVQPLLHFHHSHHFHHPVQRDPSNLVEVCNKRFRIYCSISKSITILLGKRRLRKIPVVIKTIGILGAYDLFAREDGGRRCRNHVGCLHVVR